MTGHDITGALLAEWDTVRKQTLLAIEGLPPIWLVCADEKPRDRSRNKKLMFTEVLHKNGISLGSVAKKMGIATASLRNRFYREIPMGEEEKRELSVITGLSVELIEECIEDARRTADE